MANIPIETLLEGKGFSCEAGGRSQWRNQSEGALAPLAKPLRKLPSKHERLNVF